jgi:hypothetical protein
MTRMWIFSFCKVFYTPEFIIIGNSDNLKNCHYRAFNTPEYGNIHTSVGTNNQGSIGKASRGTIYKPVD